MLKRHLVHFCINLDHGLGYQGYYEYTLTMTIILYAIPGFFLLIALEMIVDRVRNTGYYRLNDAISSLSVGMLSRVATVIKALIPLSLYAIIIDSVAMISWPQGWVAWLAAFVIYDFLYYWNHRLGHEISVLWAAHVVHHSSEEYNLTTALRQTSGSFLNFFFFIPMAFLGISIETMLSIAALNLVYQFWVHTRHIDKLGALDRILVTPSNHRVHHAQNDIYIDKNYGGVFILWDRMFGTFQEEVDSEPPLYGIRTPLRSWNPIWTNVKVYKQLFSDSMQTRKWGDKLRVWFGRTGWRPEDVLAKSPVKPAFNPAQFKKFDVALSSAKGVYACLQLAMGFVLTLAMLLNLANLSTMQLVSWCIVLTVTLVSLGAVIELKPWTAISEIVKWVLVAFAVLFSPAPMWSVYAVIVLFALSTLWLMWCRIDPQQQASRI